MHLQTHGQVKHGYLWRERDGVCVAQQPRQFLRARLAEVLGEETQQPKRAAVTAVALAAASRVLRETVPRRVRDRRRGRNAHLACRRGCLVGGWGRSITVAIRRPDCVVVDSSSSWLLFSATPSNNYRTSRGGRVCDSAKARAREGQKKEKRGRNAIDG
jgi:hypothetical protein